MRGPHRLRALRHAFAGGILLILWGAAQAAEPDAFDPLLDVAPKRGGPGQRLKDPDPRAPGFAVAAFGGLYLGANQSYLTTELSELQTGAVPVVGFSLGGRTRSPFEVAFDTALAFGNTWSPKEDGWLSTTDLLLQAKLLFHGLEWGTGGFYLGAGAHLALFDVGLEGLNQAGVGPLFLAGAQYRLGHNLLMYLELAYVPLFDLLAYHYDDPTEEELIEDPQSPRIKVTGGWFHVAMVQVGFRLSAL